MKFETLLGIVGLMATIIFGLLSVVLFIRKRYQGEIAFMFEDTISLFDEIVRNLPEISIMYRSKPISENLVLLRGSLMNVGFKDIEPAMTIAPLRAKLPEGFVWLQVRIVASSPGVEASLDANETGVEFRLGFFRRNEFVRMEALIEVPPRVGVSESRHPATQVVRSLVFSHRIVDTGKIVFRSVPSPIIRPKNRLIFTAIILLMVGLMTYPNVEHGWFGVLTLVGFTIAGLMMAYPAIDELRDMRQLRQIIGYSSEDSGNLAPIPAAPADQKAPPPDR